jgi:hypothetical protein
MWSSYDFSKEETKFGPAMKGLQGLVLWRYDIQHNNTHFNDT